MADLPWVAVAPIELGVFRIHGDGGAAAHGGEMPGRDEHGEDHERHEGRAQRQRAQAALHDASCRCPGLWRETVLPLAESG